jgi:hypothetical protein
MSNVIGKSGVTPTESKTTGTVGNFSHGSRETPVTSVFRKEAERSEKARCHNSDMHVTGESHSSIVPGKPANKGGVPMPAESVEGRGLTKENTERSLLDRTQSRETDGEPWVTRSRGLLGVREAARKDRRLRFTNLLHHITEELLRDSFFELKKQAAPGIDGERWQEYAKDLERRIVYCKDDDRRGDGEHVSFDFLGYTFQPRRAKNRWGKYFVSFLPAISAKAAKSIRQTIREWRMASTRNNQQLEDLARALNPTMWGWANYYGRFYRSKFLQVLRHFNEALSAWVRRKYKKRFRRRERASMHWLGRVARREPRLFVPWQLGLKPEARK